MATTILFENADFKATSSQRGRVILRSIVNGQEVELSGQDAADFTEQVEASEWPEDVCKDVFINEADRRS